MAEEVVATFTGPLDSFSINLSVENASNADVRSFAISSLTAKFPSPGTRPEPSPARPR